MTGFLRYVLFLGLGWLLTQTAWAVSPSELTTVEDIVELEAKPAPKVQLSQPMEQVEAPLKAGVVSTKDLSAEDSHNLTTLWKTVVDKNPVIQYSLKQLATPPELRYAHSSIMTRTISGLLSGMALVPYAFGADQITTGATTIGSNMLDRALLQSQKIDPNLLPSDTELVELSGVVQHLQQSLVSHYFGYKNSLNTLVQLQAMADALRSKVEQARTSAEPMDDLMVEQLYLSTQNQIVATRHAAQRHYLVLERLVGVDGMRTLRFDDPPPPDSGKITNDEAPSVQKSTL